MSYVCYYLFSEIQLQNSKSNTMEDINGDINKSSSQDIINRDTGTKKFISARTFLQKLLSTFSNPLKKKTPQ